MEEEVFIPISVSHIPDTTAFKRRLDKSLNIKADSMDSLDNTVKEIINTPTTNKATYILLTLLCNDPKVPAHRKRYLKTIAHNPFLEEEEKLTAIEKHIVYFMIARLSRENNKFTTVPYL